MRPGLTEFRTRASAATATINNRGHITVGDAAGRTLFYDDSTASNATLRTFNGTSDYGRIEFHDRSTAADANIFLDNDPTVTASRGGYLIFYNDSTAARSDITLRAGTTGYSGIQFNDKATAADAQIVAEDSGGNIIFRGTSSAGDPQTADTPEWANFTLARGNVVGFYEQSTADDAHFTLADRARFFFRIIPRPDTPRLPPRAAPSTPRAPAPRSRSIRIRRPTRPPSSSPAPPPRSRHPRPSGSSTDPTPDIPH